MNGLDGVDPATHGCCLAWHPGLAWLQAGSDLLIAGACLSVSAALLTFMRRRRDLAFTPDFGLFAAFILACGMTHLLGAFRQWVPAPWLDGAIRALTAVLSVATAVLLWRFVPKAMALPSSLQMRRITDALAREAAQSSAAAVRLRKSEERQRLLYARTPAALHAVDANGTLLDVSDRWLDLAGYERDEVIGRKIEEFYTPESAQEAADHLAALQAGSFLLAARRRLRCRDGHVRDLDVTLDVERDAGGRLERVLAAVVDMTAARETETALRAAEEHIRHTQKMEAVGQLTGGIAHDFNNLLTTIMGSLELLQQHVALDERGRRLAANAASGAARAARLTRQLLSFSRRQRLSPEPLMPDEVVAGIQGLLESTLGKRTALGVQTDLADDPWALLADRQEVEAALLNLVINARDAIAGDGRVTITIGRRVLAGGRREASGFDANSGDYVSIAVSDTGCGMSDEVRARAFEPFFTTKPQGAGTGLGLSQIYGFVSQSGGAVRIFSSPGNGTTVEMLLPRAAQMTLHALPSDRQARQETIPAK